MVPYSLSKACHECIKSKKRCDRDLPACRRCTNLSKSCSYRNEPLTKRRPGTTGAPFMQQGPRTSAARMRHSASVVDLALASMRQCTPDWTCEIGMPAVGYIVAHLQHYPIKVIRQGSTPFIHPRLYRRFQRPYALELLDVLPLSQTGDLTWVTPEHRDAVDATIDLLIQFESSTVSLVDYLGFVQALLTIQILTLFRADSTPGERWAAHERQKLLVRCSEKLWFSAPSELPASLRPCDAYILAESTRRTLLVSYALQAAYCILTTGSFAHTPFGSALPFDANGTLWDEDCADGNCIHSNTNTNLVSYREYVGYFEAGKTGQLSSFEKMLLVGCHGVESVEVGRVVG